MGVKSSKVQVEVPTKSGSSGMRRKSSVWQLSLNQSSESGLKRADELIVQIMMPLYFTEDIVRFQDVFDAKLSWDKIMKDVSPEFEVRKISLPYRTCREWFEAAFYERLFDVHPVSCYDLCPTRLRDEWGYYLATL
jgi:hypothetical protein